MYNWEITVNNPTLTENMKFLVRYKKLPDGNWVDLLPSPTSNTFTIPALDEANYQAEIKVMCENGTISTPKLVDLNCNDGPIDDPVDDNPRVIRIRWADQNPNPVCDLKGRQVCFNTIRTNDLDKFVIVHLQRSTNGSEYETINVVSTQNIDVRETTQGTYYYRYKAVDSNNISVYSNVLEFKVIKSVDYRCQKHVFRNTNPIVYLCTCRGQNIPCGSQSCPSGEEEINPYQEPQTVTWLDCETGQEMSATIGYGETLTVNRRI